MPGRIDETPKNKKIINTIIKLEEFIDENILEYNQQ